MLVHEVLGTCAMMRRALAFVWYVGALLALAIIGGTFVLVGLGQDVTEQVTTVAEATITHADYVDSSTAMSHGSGIVTGLAALLPIVIPLAIIAFALILIGYWGMRGGGNHKPV